MREVAIDSTHGTNAYNFQLTTVMVIDDHGEGYPAAFCYSNRVDEVAMALFFTAIKNALGSALGNNCTKYWFMCLVLHI